MNAFVEIFNTYSLSDIVIFLVLFASAIMATGKFFEWSTEILKKFFDKEHRMKSKETVVNNRLKEIEEQLKDAEKERTTIMQTLEYFSGKLEILVDSDKDSIKAYLTDKHHYFFYKQGWIDDYNLDCIERRYVHYKKAGGNSFIDHLMEELRTLPNQASKTKE